VTKPRNLISTTPTTVSAKLQIQEYPQTRLYHKSKAKLVMAPKKQEEARVVLLGRIGTNLKVC